MEVKPAVHPSAATLKALSQGTLDDAAAETVLSHLEGCAECYRVVATLSGDDFLKRLRRAHGRESSPAAGPPGIPETIIEPAPPPPTLSADLPPELATSPQYEVMRELGRGGMGVVYLARNKLMDRLEVLKVVNQEVLGRAGGKERFLREIQSAARLHHPNVVTAYSVLPTGNLLVFAMEYIEGEDLAKVAKSRGPLPVANACYYVQQAALGLQHAFEKKMVHRDIKPQNLILCQEGKKQVVKVLDFGLAKVVREEKEDAALTGTGQALGTPDYMAPEQILDAAKADIRADIYSLGCTLYYLLIGRPPFEGSSVYMIFVAHQSAEAPAVTQLRPEVPAELAAVVKKLMAKDPAQRYQTPVEVAQALMPFIKLGVKSAVGKPSPSATEAQGGGGQKPAASSAGEPGKLRPPIPKQNPPSDWETLSGSVTSSEPQKSMPAPRPQPAVKPAGKKWLIGASVAVGLLLISLVALWAGGVFNVKTKDGVIELTDMPDGAEVLVDGNVVTVTPLQGDKYEVRVQPGTRKVEVKTRSGIRITGEEVSIAEGERKVLSAKFSKAAGVAAAKAGSSRARDQSLDAVASALKKDKQAYEEATKAAEVKLLAAFDRGLDGLPILAKTKTEERLKLIDVVKAEKEAFQKNGRIPWSVSMRIPMHEYLRALAENKLRYSQAFDKAIDLYLKKKDEEKAKACSSAKILAMKPRLVAVWRYSWAPGKTERWEFYSDGLVARGPVTWTLDKDLLIARKADPKVKGGFWIDTLRISRNGKTMAGTNQFGQAKSATLVED